MERNHGVRKGMERSTSNNEKLRGNEGGRRTEEAHLQEAEWTGMAAY